MSPMTRSGSAISRSQLLYAPPKMRPPAGGQPSGRGPSGQAISSASERYRQDFLGVAGVKEAVRIDDHRGNFLALGVIVQDVKASWAEPRVALARAAELAIDDRLHAILFAVNRNHKNVLARHLSGCLDGGDRAKRHFVIVGVDDRRVGMSLQQRLRYLTALVASEVAGLAGENYHAGGLGFDCLVKALLAVVRRRSADRALELDDLALAAGLFDRPIGHSLTFLHEIRANEGEKVDTGLGERWIDVTVDQEHRNAGLLGVHNRRNERLFFARRQEDEVDPLRDHAVDVSDLLGGRAGCVGIDDLATALRRFVLHTGGLRQAPGIVALRLGEANLVGILLLQRRHLAECGINGESGGGADRPNKRLSATDEHCVSSFRRPRLSRPRTAF